MKIAVCLKHVVTRDAAVRVDESQTWIRDRDAAFELNDEGVDLVLTGLQSDDQGFAQVGVILAEVLGLSHATIVIEVQVTGDALRVRRELEGGWFQWVTMPLPALLTIQSGINQLRYATLKGIM